MGFERFAGSPFSGTFLRTPQAALSNVYENGVYQDLGARPVWSALHPEALLNYPKPETLSPKP